MQFITTKLWISFSNHMINLNHLGRESNQSNLKFEVQVYIICDQWLWWVTLFPVIWQYFQDTPTTYLALNTGQLPTIYIWFWSSIHGSHLPYKGATYNIIWNPHTGEPPALCLTLHTREPPTCMIYLALHTREPPMIYLALHTREPPKIYLAGTGPPYWGATYHISAPPTHTHTSACSEQPTVYLALHTGELDWSLPSAWRGFVKSQNWKTESDDF